VWTYSPRKHKTLHRGKERIVPLGPNARALLAAFLTDKVLEPSSPIFSPVAAQAARYAALREKRQSPVPPSQKNRKKANPKRKPRERYAPHAITQAVRIAAEKPGVEHWFPYQLRHAFGTKARKLAGLEAAGAALGHTKMSVTEVYAERDRALAVVVAEKLG
jgi:integrase